MHFLSCISLLTAVVSVKGNHLKLDFDVVANEAELNKRSGSAELSLASQKNFYSVSLKIGSQGAVNSVVLDTGSSDLWVMANDVTCVPSLRGGGGSSCMVNGTFNPGASTTFKNATSAPIFNITYGDSSYALGYYGSDSVSFGSVTVPQCEFGVVENTTSSFGVFGIGLPALETGNFNTKKYNGTGFVYPNFPSLLKSNGVIQKNVYSLYLNSPKASTGSVLFGAVDHAKYSGTLQTVPLVNPYPEYFAQPTRFQIVLNNIIVKVDGLAYIVTSSAIPALLDSGSTVSYLPEKLVQNIASMVEGSDTGLGLYQVDCKYQKKSDFVDFYFSGQRISVPFSDLIISSNSLCFLGLVSIPSDPKSGDPTAILGQNFLRHAYVVYDLDAYEISLAQVNYNATESIEVVTSTIPSAVRATGYASTSLAESIAGSLNTSTISTSSTASSSATGTKSSEGIKEMYLGRAVFYAVMGALFVAVM